MTQARRFEDLKVDHEGKDIPQLEPVETAVRTLTKLAIADGGAEPTTPA
jgi:DNA recombination protein RmuC